MFQQSSDGKVNHVETKSFIISFTVPTRVCWNTVLTKLDGTNPFIILSTVPARVCWNTVLTKLDRTLF